MFEWLIVSSSQFVIFSFSEIMLIKTLLIKKWMMLEIVDKNIFKIIALPNILPLVFRF